MTTITKSTLYKISLKEAKSIGKNLNWLRYIKKNRDGSYTILPYDELRFKVIGKIMKLLKKEFPNTSDGDLSHLLSLYINNLK